MPVFNYNTDNVGISGDWLTEVRLLSCSSALVLTSSQSPPSLSLFSLKIDSISFNGRNISLSNPNSSVAVLPNAAFVDVGASRFCEHPPILSLD